MSLLLTIKVMLGHPHKLVIDSISFNISEASTEFRIVFLSLKTRIYILRGMAESEASRLFRTQSSACTPTAVSLVEQVSENFTEHRNGLSGGCHHTFLPELLPAHCKLLVSLSTDLSCGIDE